MSNRLNENWCKVRVIVNKDNKTVEKMSGDHDHPADAHKITIKEIRNNMKENAAVSQYHYH